MYLLFFYVIGYRKKVVLDNLRLVYPDKEEKELIEIQKRFFSHFVDSLIEGIKAITISEESIKKRYTYKNIEVIDRLYKDGKSVVLVSSHYANWEWVIGLSLQTKIDFYGSLAATGIGHASDKAVLIGLLGKTPITVDTNSVDAMVDHIKKSKKIKLL